MKNPVKIVKVKMVGVQKNTLKNYQFVKDE